MNREMARRLACDLELDKRVVDVGGGASPFPRADYVLDALRWEDQRRGSDGSVHNLLDMPPRYSKETWVQADLCAHTPWAFPDKFFDFAVCSHLLEDVRDPIWICSELNRVAKAGYIEVPSRVLEQTLGVEHPCYAGYYHHRWLITAEGNRLSFRHKPHSLHSLPDAIVTRLGAGYELNPDYATLSFFWEGSFEFEETLEFDEPKVNQELCEFARPYRQKTDLKQRIEMPPMERMKRILYYQRLRRMR